MIVEAAVSEIIVTFIYFSLFSQNLDYLFQYSDFFGNRFDLENLFNRFFTIKYPVIKSEKDNKIQIELMMIDFKLSHQG